MEKYNTREILEGLGFENLKQEFQEFRKSKNSQALTLQQKAQIILLKNIGVGFTNIVRALYSSKSPYKKIKIFLNNFNTENNLEETKEVIKYLNEKSQELKKTVPILKLNIRIATAKENKEKEKVEQLEKEKNNLLK